MHSELLSQALARATDRIHAPGAVAAVVDARGASGEGTTTVGNRGRPVAIDDRFDVGSVTKTLTATLLAHS